MYPWETKFTIIFSIVVTCFCALQCHRFEKLSEEEGKESGRLVRREKNKLVLELILLRDQPCTQEMLENTQCERIHVFVFALDCFLSTKEMKLSHQITECCEKF